MDNLQGDPTFSSPPNTPSPAAVARSPANARLQRVLPAVLIAVAIIGFAVIVAGAVFLVRREMRRVMMSQNPYAVPLSELYKSGNGLITAHYPADFAAQRLGEGAIVVSRHLLGGEEGISLIAVNHPISDDAGELSRIMEVETEKALTTKGGTYVIGEPGPTQCVTSSANRAGVERVSTYRSPLGVAFRRWSCTFLAGGHA